MNITIQPGLLSGRITAIPSKSQAHRLLICAALADGPTTLLCPETNRDIEATAGCLNALGAAITRTPEGYEVIPIGQQSAKADLFCHDSGSTLRFLLPLACALGVDTTLHMEGRLPQRPLSPLWEEMERMGCSLSRPSPDTIRCTGQLKPGEYVISGGVSSQFITGLMLALPNIPGTSKITITGQLESKPYVDMTCQAMDAFGYHVENFQISGGKKYHTPGTLTVEGDWSNGAFFLAANALGSQVIVENLSQGSAQGDKQAAKLLPLLQKNMTISAADIPDLVPILAVVAAFHQGATFTNVCRLRLKESDRVASVAAMIHALGGRAYFDEHTLTVEGTGLTGGTVSSENDHRIAMAAAIAATRCQNPTTVLRAQCTEKSYPQFWAEFRRLGGTYEQHLR